MEQIDALTAFIWFAPKIVLIFSILFITSGFCIFYVIWQIYIDPEDMDRHRRT
ncbi:hypothetical protein SRRS_44130 [Sporomusa rhizae]